MLLAPQDYRVGRGREEGELVVALITFGMTLRRLRPIVKQWVVSVESEQDASFFGDAVERGPFCTNRISGVGDRILDSLFACYCRLTIGEAHSIGYTAH